MGRLYGPIVGGTKNVLNPTVTEETTRASYPNLDFSEKDAEFHFPFNGNEEVVDYDMETQTTIHDIVTEVEKLSKKQRLQPLLLSHTLIGVKTMCEKVLTMKARVETNTWTIDFEIVVDSSELAAPVTWGQDDVDGQTST